MSNALARITGIEKLKSYAQLRRRVERAFREGRTRAEAAVDREKVRTYWHVGRYIDAHILFHKERAGYGKQVIQRLARHTEASPTLLYDCLRFHRVYPILPARVKFGWTQIKNVLSIKDETQRKALIDEAGEKGWDSRTLGARIRRLSQRGPALPKIKKRLVPKQGSLHTYRTVQSEIIHGEGKETLLDLGFSSFIELPRAWARKFRDGDIVRSGARPRLLKLAKAKPSDLFTYKAYVERVIDGDTLWVRVDLGFEIWTRWKLWPRWKFWTRQKLRLRGIDAPELNTKAGKAAKRFLEELLKPVPFVILTTSKSDKWDRYVTDLYLPQPDGPDSYVNQLLVDRGFARLASL